MNLRQLEAFVEVAEDGSFSKAAKNLFLTQPTVSAHISSLEKELGVRLFVRNTKEVNLSEHGHLLYKYASQIVELEKKIEEDFGKCKDGRKKCVTIAASTIPAQYILPTILVKFNEKYPKEQLKIKEMDSSKVIDCVAEHGADIGFTGTVLEKKYCEYIPFYKDELVVITPNTEKYKNLEKEEIDWIKNESLLMREEGSGTRKEAEKQLRENGINPEELNLVATIQNPETIKKSVSHGVGISILSCLAVKEELKAGKLLAYPLTKEKKARDINVIYNKNCCLSSSAEKFLKTVKEMYQL